MRGAKQSKRDIRKTSRSINRAVAGFDFEDFLLGQGIEVEMKPNQIAGICPFCSWKRTSFYVNPENGLWICHYCGEKGGPIQLICKVMECSYTRALDVLFDNFEVFVNGWDDFDEDEDYKEIEVATISLPEGHYLLADNDSETAAPYLRYARSRGLTDELIRTFSIGYTATGYYRGRIIVPVYHFGGLVNWVARAISKKAERKVLTPPGNEQYKYIFNLDNLWGVKEVVVMEGVFDALVLPEIAVASFGKKLTTEQANLLRQSGVKRITFCYDNDAIEEGEKYARRWVRQFDTYIINMPEGEDPNSLGREKMLKMLDTAEPMKIFRLAR